MKRFIALFASIAVLAVGLTGCSSTSIVSGSEISIAQLDAFDSFNSDVANAIDSQQVNSEISYLTTPAFYYSDASGELVANEAFGSVLVEKKAQAH